VNTDLVESLRGGNLLHELRVLPNRHSELAGPSTVCRYVGWPNYLNSHKYLTVVRTESDCITGLLRPEPALDADQVVLILTAAPEVTWWKGAELARELASDHPRTPSQPEQYETLVGVYTQESYQGPDSSSPLRLATLGRNIFLQLRKAGAFGVHVTMYRLPFHMPGGHSLTLYWERDCALRDL
jgi:hypothetical protein